MPSNPPDVFALVLGLPLVFVLVWFLARVVGGRWVDDVDAVEPVGVRPPGLEPEGPGVERIGSAAPADGASAPSRDTRLDRPEGIG